MNNNEIDIKNSEIDTFTDKVFIDKKDHKKEKPALCAESVIMMKRIAHYVPLVIMNSWKVSLRSILEEIKHFKIFAHILTKHTESMMTSLVR